MSSSGTVVRAAGLIVYRNTNPIQYLLLKASYYPYHWTPPKGHVDAGEDEFATAVRETMEEAGLGTDDLDVDNHFSKVLQYKVNEKDKTVTYWLARASLQSKVKISNEHTAFEWVNVADACKLSKYPDMIELLNSAEQYLQNK